MIVHFYNGDLAKRKGKINKRFMQDNFENLITHKDMQNMEEGIAASYLAAYLHIDYKQFEVRESPDLALTFDNKMVGVEITTLRPSIYMTFPMDKPSKGQSIQAVENAVRKIIYECMLDLNLFDLTMQIELEPELYFGGIQVKKVKDLLKSSFMDIFANFSNDVVEIDSSKVLRSYKYGKHGYFLSVEFTCYPNSGFDKLIKNNFSVISDIIKFTFHGFFHPLPFWSIEPFIRKKEKKLTFYKNQNTNFQEYWLCLYLPETEYYFTIKGVKIPESFETSYDRIIMIQSKPPFCREI